MRLINIFTKTYKLSHNNKLSKTLYSSENSGLKKKLYSFSFLFVICL